MQWQIKKCPASLDTSGEMTVYFWVWAILKRTFEILRLEDSESTLYRNGGKQNNERAVT